MCVTVSDTNDRARSRLPLLSSHMTMRFKIQRAPDGPNPDDRLPLAHTYGTQMWLLLFFVLVVKILVFDTLPFCAVASSPLRCTTIPRRKFCARSCCTPSQMTSRCVYVCVHVRVFWDVRLTCLARRWTATFGEFVLCVSFRPCLWVAVRVR